MKWIRNFRFKKNSIYISGEGFDAQFREVKDSALVNYALKISNKYGCRINKIECSCSEIYIDIWSTKQSFLAFVNDYTEHFENYIERIQF